MAGTTDLSSSVKVVSGLPASALSGPDVRDSGLRRALGLLGGKGYVLQGAQPSYANPTLTIPKGKILMPLDDSTVAVVEHPAVTVTFADGEEAVFRLTASSGKDAVFELVLRTAGATVGLNELLVGSRSGSTFTFGPEFRRVAPGRTVLTARLDATDFPAGNDVPIISPVYGRIRRAHARVAANVTVAASDVTASVNGGTATDLLNVAISSAGARVDGGELADSADLVVEPGDVIDVASDGASTAGAVDVTVEIE